jgi:hypothetical protein
VLPDLIQPEAPGFVIGVATLCAQGVQVVVAVAQADAIQRGNPSVVGLTNYGVKREHEGAIARCFLLNELTYPRWEQRQELKDARVDHRRRSGRDSGGGRRGGVRVSREFARVVSELGSTNTPVD